MSTQTIQWIGVMGAEQDIEATVYHDEHVVLVDGANLTLMAESIVRAGITTEEGDRAYADQILAVPADADGLHDVTEVVGGWETWAYLIDSDDWSGHVPMGPA